MSFCLFMTVFLAQSATGVSSATQSVFSEGGLWGLFLKGGIFMWPILLSSVVMVAVALERLVSLRSGMVRPRRLVKEVERRIRAGNPVAAVEKCASKGASAYARMVHACLQRAGSEHYAMEEALEEAGGRVLYDLRKGTRPLGVIADVAPLLGLLGTVTGMIKAFNVVASAGALGKAELLAEGIGEALMTTAFGLCVAVPAIILYHAFRGRAENWVRVIEDECLEYARLVRDGKETLQP